MVRYLKTRTKQQKSRTKQRKSRSLKKKRTKQRKSRSLKKKQKRKTSKKKIYRGGDGESEIMTPEDWLDEGDYWLKSAEKGRKLVMTSKDVIIKTIDLKTQRITALNKIIDIFGDEINMEQYEKLIEGFIEELEYFIENKLLRDIIDFNLFSITTVETDLKFAEYRINKGNDSERKTELKQLLNKLKKKVEELKQSLEELKHDDNAQKEYFNAVKHKAEWSARKANGANEARNHARLKNDN